jgi:ligand-binding sensor domain-containing protein
MPGVAGVEHKYFGSFTERAFWIEMMKIDRRALWISTSEGARRLIVTLSGSATLNGLEIGRLAAIQADSGEGLYVSATEKTVLYIIGLPPVQLPITPSDQFDVIERDGAIQFEDSNQAA